MSAGKSGEASRQGAGVAGVAGVAGRKRRRRKGRLLVWIEYALFRLVVAAFRRASPARLDRWSRRTGALAARVLRSRDRLATRNLQRVYPAMAEAERERILRECWRHYARSVFEYLHTIDWPFERIASRYVFEGPSEALFESIRTRPTIVVTAHLGNWEMAASLLALFERPLTAVARPLDNPRIHEHLLRGRVRSGVRVLDRRGAGRELIRALDRGDSIVMVADQAVKPAEGVLVPFLGIPAWTTTAPARLAIRFDAPIWCVVSIPEAGYRLLIDEPILPSELPEHLRTVEGVTRAMNDRISARIHARPGLWLWMHDRWKGVSMDFPAAPLV
ncbi:MAG TPA: lysophospholipid acyltransferase family protein [Thermoanaerobaculia bacterium]|nr:lysophospholipid acyltransferase family protein [Thermoanaerobaculia bacterium]